MHAPPSAGHPSTTVVSVSACVPRWRAVTCQVQVVTLSGRTSREAGPCGVMSKPAPVSSARMKRPTSGVNATVSPGKGSIVSLGLSGVGSATGVRSACSDSGSRRSGGA